MIILHTLGSETERVHVWLDTDTEGPRVCPWFAMIELLPVYVFVLFICRECGCVVRVQGNGIYAWHRWLLAWECGAHWARCSGCIGP